MSAKASTPPPNILVREGKQPRQVEHERGHRASGTVGDTDNEMFALNACVSALSTVETAARRRVIDYLNAKYPAAQQPEKRNHPVVGKEPAAPNLEVPGDVSAPARASGGHHYDDSTIGRWGGPYV